MSGSRTAINPQGPNNNDSRELVYCHDCYNEFYKDGPTGLICPECHSEVTEVIDPDFDPRTWLEDDEPDLRSHNPWSVNPDQDPEEPDIEHFVNTSLYPPSSIFNRPGQQQQGLGQSGLPPELATNPIFGNFASMLQSMSGTRPGSFGPAGVMPGFSNPQPPSDRSRSAPGSPPPPDGGAGGGSRPQVSVFTRSGPGYSFTATSTRGGFQNFGGRHELNRDHVDTLLQSVFQEMGRGPNGLFMGSQTTQGPRQPGAAGGMPHTGLAGLFNALLNPANAVSGDAVYTQEAFDRIMSQLMEEHTSGSAPGPASEDAIKALPREQVTANMLQGENKLAECSVCMDSVSVGDEITTLPCNHWFHFQCVEAWLKEHDTCPVCRRGIMPKEGDRNTARSPTEEPLHNEDPFVLARQQSGSREHPFVVPESPSVDRRRPNPRRPSSNDPSSSSRRQSDTGNDRNEGGGISGRMRSFFGGAGSGNNNNNGSNSYNNRP